MNRSLQVSFKLADLLTGAPLHAARKHALEWAEREPNNQEAQAVAANFKPSRCLEWLRASSSKTSHQDEEENSSNSSGGDVSDDEADSQQKPPAARFKVFDLIEAAYLFGARPIGVEEELRLPVSPSGVRAVRLEAV